MIEHGITDASITITVFNNGNASFIAGEAWENYGVVYSSMDEMVADFTADDPDYEILITSVEPGTTWGEFVATCTYFEDHGSLVYNFDGSEVDMNSEIASGYYWCEV